MGWDQWAAAALVVSTVLALLGMAWKVVRFLAIANNELTPGGNSLHDKLDDLAQITHKLVGRMDEFATWHRHDSQDQWEHISALERKATGTRRNGW